MRQEDQRERPLLDKLDTLGLTENTLVILTSDNGGLVEVNGNAPLKAGKGFYYEGGIREPLIVRYPGIVPAESLQHQPVSSIDFYPTVLDLCGISLEEKVDGLNIRSLLQNPQASLEREALYWHYPHYHTPQRPPTGAVRSGDFKLIEYFEDMRVELYNLKEDIGETNDLAAEFPEKAEELQKMLHQWRTEVGAAMPETNPAYDPENPFSGSVPGWNGQNRLIPDSE